MALDAALEMAQEATKNLAHLSQNRKSRLRTCHLHGLRFWPHLRQIRPETVFKSKCGQKRVAFEDRFWPHSRQTRPETGATQMALEGPDLPFAWPRFWPHSRQIRPGGCPRIDGRADFWGPVGILQCTAGPFWGAANSARRMSTY